MGTVSRNDDEEERADGRDPGRPSDTLYWVVRHSWYCYTQAGKPLVFKLNQWEQNQNSFNPNITFMEGLSYLLHSGRGRGHEDTAIVGHHPEQTSLYLVCSDLWFLVQSDQVRRLWAKLDGSSPEILFWMFFFPPRIWVPLWKCATCVDILPSVHHDITAVMERVVNICWMLWVRQLHTLSYLILMITVR